jgi:hypothetical protein
MTYIMGDISFTSSYRIHAMGAIPSQTLISHVAGKGLLRKAKLMHTVFVIALNYILITI